jgi:hypothetical protein
MKECITLIIVMRESCKYRRDHSNKPKFHIIMDAERPNVEGEGHMRNLKGYAVPGIYWVGWVLEGLARIGSTS